MKLVFQLLLPICLLIFAVESGQAGQIRLGQPLPTVTLNELGKLNLEGEQISYVPWNSRELWEGVHNLPSGGDPFSGILE